MTKPRYPFSYFRHVPTRKNLEIGYQCTSFNDAVILLLVERLSEEDVIFERHVLYPGLLGHIGCLTLQTQNKRSLVKRMFFMEMLCTQAC